MLTEIVLIIATLFFLASLAIGMVIIYSAHRRERIIKNFADYTAVLEYHLSKAYEMIHKDKILIYSIEATKLPDKEFNRFSKDFARLVEKMLGKRLLKEFIYLYGGYDTFLFNVIEYFNSKYESDEIRHAAMENVMESEIEVPDSLKATPTAVK